MLVLIDSMGFDGDGQTDEVETPFGSAAYQVVGEGEEKVVVLDRASNGNPKALAYAALLLGGTRVIGVVRDSGVERPLTPANFIEFTSGRPTTFFEAAGTGYVQQNPPFCPELRQSLLDAGAEDSGSLLVLDSLPEPAVASWWRAHQVDLISTDSQPEGALCRELELCFAVLVLPETADLSALITDIPGYLPGERGCGCDELMGTARKFGKLADDWFENLG